MAVKNYFVTYKKIHEVIKKFETVDSNNFARKVGIPYCRTATYSHSFLPITASDWNHLPASLALTDDFDEFKKRLNDV